ncbi:MAG: putative ABC transporter permease [Lachnospiraceae bacterium]|nr:putative ABC transporter permease [Lachnospiraceae bacterium]
MEYLNGFESFYEVLWVFVIYSFIGWCTEVAYATLDTGKFINRGFLNGPVCPIYGCGVIIVVSILTPIMHIPLLLFLGSMLFTTLLELVVGFGLEKIFHHQWWDYSMYPFNFKGYICLKFSILWGLACTFVMYVVHPFIAKMIRIFPQKIGMVILVIALIGFATDCVIAITTIFKFSKKLLYLEKVQAQLDKLSVNIGENIYENVSDVLEVPGYVKADLTERKEEYQKKRQELLLKREELMKESKVLQHRILKAFPHMKSRTHKDALEKLRELKEAMENK